ncbi:MAG: bifunctional [glutamate--ammonia ligase]-adenylyl-L-tyrosine phosphorylase/[glutamate--ammonia-ligase] adenylyltransferase [Desulfatirhabdiaceae bacterium]
MIDRDRRNISELQPIFQKKWTDFQDSLNRQNIILPDNSHVLTSIPTVFTFSDFIAQNAIRHPHLIAELMESGDLLRSYDVTAYDNCLKSLSTDISDEAGLAKTLRRFRKREMIRIAWRDIAEWADLSETMTELSSLAEACLNHVVCHLSGWLHPEMGTPVAADGTVQNLVVLGMGKLGAKELNFSSDIDLIFAYPQAGKTREGRKKVSNEQFFTHLCRKLITVISQPDTDGLVFRIDMNLRPYGENGPLIMNFDAMEDYYLRQGREWERYAWIKARAVAGDIDAGNQLLNSLKPFIYRRYLDYGVYDSLREMKLKISHENRRKGMSGNIKLGPGGIREIEFFGQIFQLIRGGVSPDLQDRSILNILKRLVSHHIISNDICHELTRAYHFLRKTEHRLQQVADQQTHQLPVEPFEMLRLSAGMGYSDPIRFQTDLSHYMNRVHHHFSSLLTHHHATDETVDSNEDACRSIWLEHGDSEASLHALDQIGFQNPQRVMDLLNNLRNSPSIRAMSAEGKKRLDRLMPLILDAASQADDPEEVLDRIINILRAIERRTSYLSLLIENPQALKQLVRLASASPLIVTFLSRYPVLLDELLDKRILYRPPRKQELKTEVQEKLKSIPSDELEYQIEQMCIFQQVNMFRVVAADVAGVLPLMRTSDHLTELAETIIDQVLALSWDYLVEKHGMPSCVISPDNGIGFVVVAYGKLGGIELGYSSDLDLVFLHAASPGETVGRRSPVDNAQFYARLGQRIIHILTSRTRAGRLYETDMRLRPDGISGILVSHIDTFERYQLEKAWTWEHQALARARPVSGDLSLADRFETIRKQILSRIPDPVQLKKNVRNMRRQLLREHARSESLDFDLKNDRGGIIDIEFLVQYLVLLKSCDHPDLVQWTDNVRQLTTLIETGIIPEHQAFFLKEAYVTYRATVHRLSLQEKPAVVPADRFRRIRQNVIRLWNRYLGKGSA